MSDKNELVFEMYKFLDLIKLNLFTSSVIFFLN